MYDSRLSLGKCDKSESAVVKRRMATYRIGDQKQKKHSEFHSDQHCVEEPFSAAIQSHSLSDANEVGVEHDGKTSRTLP